MNAYDFDKTIYNGDSTADFYFFCLKRHKKIICCFPSLIIAAVKFFVLKKINKTQFKQTMYRFLNYCDIENDLEEFWNKAKYKIKDFYKKQKKDDDVIISASPEFLLKPICDELSIKRLIASKVDMKTGIYDGLNCHGKEKVRRFREFFGNAKVDKFYSDSKSDTPMAEIAEHAYLVNKEKITEWIF